jgi:hypothetical protein
LGAQEDSVRPIRVRNHVEVRNGPIVDPLEAYPFRRGRSFHTAK